MIMAAQYRTMNRGGHSIYEEVRKAGYEPYVCLLNPVFLLLTARIYRSDYIRFYHLRAYDRINAPWGIY